MHFPTVVIFPSKIDVGQSVEDGGWGVKNTGNHKHYTNANTINIEDQVETGGLTRKVKEVEEEEKTKYPSIYVIKHDKIP